VARLDRVVPAVARIPGAVFIMNESGMAWPGWALSSLWVTEAGIFKDEDTSRGRKAGRIAAG